MSTMSYVAPKSTKLKFHLHDVLYDTKDGISIVFNFTPTSFSSYGLGYLSGQLLKDGNPVVGTVYVFTHNPLLEPANKELIATTVSSSLGYWRVEGLNTLLSYDVIAEVDGLNSKIYSNTTPIL